MERMKILIVDDEIINLEILIHILSKDYQPYTLNIARSGKEALNMVARDKPDLILLDIIMADMNGYDVLAALKRSDTTRLIPVIIITGLDSVEDEEKGFFLGAVDYITKPFHASLVRARVKTHLQIVEQMRMIERLGMIDSLTGIMNRRGFDSQISMEWSRAIRQQTLLSLLMADVDHFKALNDTYGHQQGDVALQTITHVLIKTLKRPADLVARWGGEEFLMLLPETDLDGALTVAETARANVEEAVIPLIVQTNTGPLKATISIGIAIADPSLCGTVSDFISQADKALYSAKESGRNRVCVYVHD